MHKKYGLLLLTVLLIGFGSSIMLYTTVLVEDVQILIADTLVQREVLGLDSRTDGLHFGATKPNSISKRFVTVSSKKSAWVTVQIRGDLEGWLSVSNSSFFLEKEEPFELEFSLHVPSSKPPGNYTGKAVLVFRKPWLRRLEVS